MRIKILPTITVLLFTFSLLATYKAYMLSKNMNMDGSNVVYKAGDVLGITSEETSVAVDFGKPLSFASNMMFGGAHAPRLTDTKAWDAIQAAGITSVRLDFFLDRYLPSGITIEQYKQNYKNAQDPATWNQVEINNVRGVYEQAHKRNMKVIGILAYSKDWLSTSKTNYGVPKDWAVFDDVAEKSYRIFRPNLDYLEVWNEPDMDVFLDIRNSGLTKNEAYYQVAKHSMEMIRKVDNDLNDGKRMKIGVGVVSQPGNITIIQKILEDPNLKKQVDFVSYHNYENQPEPSNKAIIQILSKNNMSQIPVFMTEWAHTPNIKKSDSYVLNDQAIPYAGAKLIDFMKMGLAGANYFSLQPIQPQSPRGDEGMLGFYTGAGTKISMLPIIRTWSLMSKTLSLGSGMNTTFSVGDTDEKVLAWKNSELQNGIVVSNQNFTTKTYNITVYNIPYPEDLTVEAYVASKDQDGKKRVGTTLLRYSKTGSTFKIVAPPNSLVGVKFTPATLREKFGL